MKNLFLLPAILALTILGGCQKRQTEEARNAEIEHQVQQRLAAENQAQAQQQVAQRAAELDAREKALAEKQNAAANTPAPETPRLSVARRTSDASGNPATASYSTFYAKLERYGVWRETSNYGYVWQPREAEQSRNWRPYTYGRWVYTDAGWTWISEEPFGWGAYHYDGGRGCAISDGFGYREMSGLLRGYHGARATITSVGRRSLQKRVSISATASTIGPIIITTSAQTNIVSFRQISLERSVSSALSFPPIVT